jgi:hypothetical protein
MQRAVRRELDGHLRMAFDKEVHTHARSSDEVIIDIIRRPCHLGLQLSRAEKLELEISGD